MSRTDILKRILQSDTVKRLLREGRGAEVTEDMFAGASPVHLRQNYDIPLDDGARLRRAIELNAGVPEVTRDALTAIRSMPATDGKYYVAEDNITPMDIYGLDPALYTQTREFYGPRLNSVYGVDDFDQVDNVGPLPAEVAEALQDAGYNVEGYDDLDAVYSAYAPYGLRGVERAMDSPTQRAQAEAYIKSLSARDSSGTLDTPEGRQALLDALETPPPRVVRRSSRALMDPRLAHLRNIMATATGVGYGISQQDADEIERYLEQGR